MADSSKIKRGARGAGVALAQTMLNSLGAGLEVDGAFGPKTEAAVRAFQAHLGAWMHAADRPWDGHMEHDLIAEDGAVGFDTVHALGAVVSGGPALTRWFADRWAKRPAPEVSLGFSGDNTWADEGDFDAPRPRLVALINGRPHDLGEIYQLRAAEPGERGVASDALAAAVNEYPGGATYYFALIEGDRLLIQETFDEEPAGDFPGNLADAAEAVTIATFSLDGERLDVFAPGLIAGTYGWGHHDEAWVLEINDDGGPPARLYYFDAATEGAGSPNAAMAGEAPEATRITEPKTFEVNRFTGIVTGDLGKGIVVQTAEGLRVDLTEQHNDIADAGYLQLRPDFTAIF